MTHVKKSLLLLSLLLPVLLAVPCHAGQFKVTRVYDGDTEKAEGYDVEINVRLVGIDAPETSKKKREEGQPFSQQATKHLAGLVLNKTVDIKGYGMDGYGRVLGVITVGGKNVNLEMVRVGYAEVYRGKPPHGFEQSVYLKVEQEARGGKRGMWLDGMSVRGNGGGRTNKKNLLKLSLFRYYFCQCYHNDSNWGDYA